MAKVAGAKRFITISDVHLYHRKTPIEHIMETLDTYVFTARRLLGVDGILIPGDLFDRWVKLSMGDTFWHWAYDKLQLCKDLGVAIRVLEGTPSHDWKQSKLLQTINDSTGIGADLLYIDELTVMEDPTFGLIFGYIPDEIRPTCNQIMDDLETLMAVRGIDRLDVVLSHGFFDFQLPPGVTNALDTARLSNLTNYVIFNGHDHKSKSKDKVQVPGSWDRCSHGEEGPKGGIVTDIVNGTVTHEFLENPDAYPYITLDLSWCSDPDIITRLDDHLEQQRKGYLRLYVPKETDLRDHINNVIKTAKVDIDVEYKGATAIDKANDAFNLSVVTVNITPENIEELVLAEIDEPAEQVVDTIRLIKGLLKV